MTMVATLSPEVRDAFHAFGEILTELLKLAALLVFGVLISPGFLAEIPPSGYAFALLALLVVRRIALGIAFFGSGLDWREQAAAAWFGPKGFASVGRRALPPARDRHRGVHHCPFVDRCHGGSLVSEGGS